MSEDEESAAPSKCAYNNTLALKMQSYDKSQPSRKRKCEGNLHDLSPLKFLKRMNHHGPDGKFSYALCFSDKTESKHISTKWPGNHNREAELMEIIAWSLSKVRLYNHEESSIYLNSKRSCKDGKYTYLSNFHGMVECLYQQTKWNDPIIASCYNSIYNRCHDNVEEFLKCLKALQPFKKFTPNKEKFWLTKKNKPIIGILFKLMQGAAKKRNKESDIRLEFILRETKCPKLPESGSLEMTKYLFLFREKYLHVQLPTDVKLVVMVKCMLCRYKHDDMGRQLLLSTGSQFLHEVPMRGKPSLWTFKDGEGGNLFGKALMVTRAILREIINVT